MERQNDAFSDRAQLFGNAASLYVSHHIVHRNFTKVTAEAILLSSMCQKSLSGHVMKCDHLLSMVCSLSGSHWC